MSKVIICGNQKGGVAKTTTVVNLGIGLARKGKKVLVIDNDPQGSLTEALGYQEPDRLEITLAQVMDWVLNEEKFDLNAGILHHAEGVDLMPANIELSGVETSLVGIMSSETVLKEYIEMIDDRYDYIIVDCSPNLGQLTLNALVAADEIIIPVQAAYLSIKGLEQLLKTISRVKRKMNPKLHIMGILLTMVDYRTNYANEISSLVVSIAAASEKLRKSILTGDLAIRRPKRSSAEGNTSIELKNVEIVSYNVIRYHRKKAADYLKSLEERIPIEDFSGRHVVKFFEAQWNELVEKYSCF